jgi:outer membrane protein assembly factor BamB
MCEWIGVAMRLCVVGVAEGLLSCVGSLRGSARVEAVALVLLTFLATAASAAPGDLLFTLKAPDRQAGWFGYTVAPVDGDILVGAITADLGLPIDATGRAYLFDGETGKHRQTFNLPEPMEGDTFASSLAGGDGRVFISARGAPARVYSFDATSGQHLYTIGEPTRFHNAFGAQLAYDGGSVLISSPAFGVPFGPQTIGQAGLFDAVTGQLLRPLPNPEPKPGDNFGTSVAVFEDRAIVGAMLDDLPGDDRPDGDNPGRVWVFDRLTGEIISILENPNPQKIPPFFLSDGFGWSVAANADVIAVGARQEDANGVNNSGAAYVFDAESGVLKHTLLSPILDENANFGGSVSITPSGHVLVGASGASVDGFSAAGRAYLFDSITGDLLLDIQNPDPARISGFAFSTVATDRRIFIGSPTDEAVYVFESIPEPSSLVLAGSLLLTSFAIRPRRGGQGPRLRLRVKRRR